MATFPAQAGPSADWRFSRARRRRGVRIAVDGRRRPAPLGAIAAWGTVVTAGLFGLLALVADLRSGTSTVSFARATGSPSSDGRGDDHAPPPAFSRYAGRWVPTVGKGLVVGRTGAVWLDEGGRIGAMSRDGDGDGDVALAGVGFRCAYTVRFDSPDVSVWHLAGASPRSVCPQGRMTRPFTY